MDTIERWIGELETSTLFENSARDVISWRLTRRSFLSYGVGGSGTLALGACTTIPSEPPPTTLGFEQHDRRLKVTLGDRCWEVDAAWFGPDTRLFITPDPRSSPDSRSYEVWLRGGFLPGLDIRANFRFLFTIPSDRWIFDASLNGRRLAKGHDVFDWFGGCASRTNKPAKSDGVPIQVELRGRFLLNVRLRRVGLEVVQPARLSLFSDWSFRLDPAEGVDHTLSVVAGETEYSALAATGALVPASDFSVLPEWLRLEAKDASAVLKMDLSGSQSNGPAVLLGSLSENTTDIVEVAAGSRLDVNIAFFSSTSGTSVRAIEAGGSGFASVRRRGEEPWIAGIQLEDWRWLSVVSNATTSSGLWAQVASDPHPISFTGVVMELRGDKNAQFRAIHRDNECIEYVLRPILHRVFLPIPDADLAELKGSGHPVQIQLDWICQIETDPWPLMVSGIDEGTIDFELDSLALCVQRSSDLFNMTFGFRNVSLQATHGEVTLKYPATSNAHRTPLLVATFPPQHLAEPAFFRQHPRADVRKIEENPHDATITEDQKSLAGNLQLRVSIDENKRPAPSQ